jgi:hypothetical protein
MALISYPIRRIGLLAQAELEISQSANLLGSTSRGLFVLAASGHVIFLSGEPFAGPWTANLHLAAGTLPLGWHELAAGKNAQIQARRLILPSARAYFDAAGAERWQPPEADPAAVELAGLEGRIQETARRLLAGGPRGFSALLEAHTVPLPEPLAQVSAAAIQLHASLRSRDLPAALQAGESLLGLGSGLTPSGDDLLEPPSTCRRRRDSSPPCSNPPASAPPRSAPACWKPRLPEWSTSACYPPSMACSAGKPPPARLPGRCWLTATPPAWISSSAFLFAVLK